MLNIAKSFSDLRVFELLDVYAASNRLLAQTRFPGKDIAEAMLQIENDLIAYLRDDFFSISGAYCAMWEEYGSYVCALRIEPYQDGLLLSGLETVSNLQNRGLAEMLIRSVLDRTDPGTAVYSHVYRRNAASMHVHKKCGFQTFLDHAVLLDGTRDAGSDTLIYRKSGLF